MDTRRIMSTGNSSGGCISLWLAFHKDMAKPRSKDAIARESTHLTCVSVDQTLTSVDPRFIQKLMPGFNLAGSNLHQLLGISIEELSALPAKKIKAIEESSPINHVTEDAPPTLIRYNGKADGRFTIHHARFGVTLKKRMDDVGATCHIVAGGETIGNSQRRGRPQHSVPGRRENRASCRSISFSGHSGSGAFSCAPARSTRG